MYNSAYVKAQHKQNPKWGDRETAVLLDMYGQVESREEARVLDQLALRIGLAWKCPVCSDILLEREEECCGVDPAGDCTTCFGERAIDCRGCSATGEGTWDGGTCWTCNGKGVTPCPQGCGN